jgi:BNR repeat-like domain
MRMFRRLAMAGAVAVVTVVSGTAAAAAPGAFNLVRVSRGDPFAGCTIGGTPTSTLYPGAEVEPSVATNRFFAGEVVGAWQQDRWSDGGSRGLVAGFSRDGGRTFGEVAWPVSRCANGLPYDRASDPWVSIGPEGVVYGSALAFDALTPRNTVAATTSFDGGRTWRNTTVLINDTEPGIVDDKNAVTADPVRLGSAYQVWDRLELSPDGALLFTGPTLLSTTRDFGQTWSSPQVIVRTGQFEQTIGNIIVADPRTGTLYDIYEDLQFTDANANVLVFARMAVVRSTDGGRTWSQPSVIADDTSVADIDPNTGQLLRTGAGIPEAAVDPRTGELYVVYEGTDFTAGAYNQVQLVHSTNGGRTWSAPIRVNGDPTVQAFTPSIAVTNDGDVGVTYYDLRTLRPGNTTTLPTSTFLTISPRGGTRFGHERQIAPVFDHLQAPFARGFFLGDYQSLTTFDDKFRALFVMTNTNQPTNKNDVFYGQFRSIDVDRSVQAGTAGPTAATLAATRAPALDRHPALHR